MIPVNQRKNNTDHRSCSQTEMEEFKTSFLGKGIFLIPSLGSQTTGLGSKKVSHISNDLKIKIVPCATSKKPKG